MYPDAQISSLSCMDETQVFLPQVYTLQQNSSSANMGRTYFINRGLVLILEC